MHELRFSELLNDVMAKFTPVKQSRKTLTRTDGVVYVVHPPSSSATMQQDAGRREVLLRDIQPEWEFVKGMPFSIRGAIAAPTIDCLRSALLGDLKWCEIIATAWEGKRPWPSDTLGFLRSIISIWEQQPLLPIHKAGGESECFFYSAASQMFIAKLAREAIQYAAWQALDHSTVQVETTSRAKRL